LSDPHDILSGAPESPKGHYGFEALAADNLRPGSVGAALTFCFLLLGQLASYPRELPFPWAGVVGGDRVDRCRPCRVQQPIESGDGGLPSPRRHRARRSSTPSSSSPIEHRSPRTFCFWRSQLAA
jgi:hypothetical protein